MLIEALLVALVLLLLATREGLPVRAKLNRFLKP